VPAPEIEELVIKAVRDFCKRGTGASALANDDALARLKRVVITPTAIQVHIAGAAVSTPMVNAGEEPAQGITGQVPTVVSVPWEPSKFIAVKGVVLATPESAPALKPENRDAILRAIAKSRLWIDELMQDKITIADIARREGKIERHVRLLLPLAFVSPRMVKAIASGHAPMQLTVTGLAKRVPFSWNQQ
jgi:site-specific DNA recombinase